MRLIDADELREYMKRHCEFCKSRLRIYEYLQGRCELCPMSQVYALIDPEAGLKTQTRKWIPCSERLPEKNGVYLVTNEEGSVFEYDYSDLTVHNGKWSFMGINVIAWMPLPDPYREEASK